MNKEIITEVLLTLAGTTLKDFQKNLGAKEKWLDEQESTFRDTLTTTIEDDVYSKIKEAFNKLSPGQRECNITFLDYREIIQEMKKRLTNSFLTELEKRNIEIPIILSSDEIIELRSEILKNQGFKF